MPSKIRIEEDFCKGCGYCIEICPKKVLMQNSKTNSKGYILPEVIDEDKCILCKKCELICPEMAISVKKKAEEEKEEKEEK